MTTEDKWEHGRKLLPEEESEYLKDLCASLREQKTLSETKRDEHGRMTCEIVPDELAAHTADVIEELLDRIQKLQYELRESKNA